MSVFKEYFFDILRWPLIAKPGPLAMLVEALARSLDDVREDIIWLRDQFNPWTSETQMIPPHALSRGIVRHESETDQQYQERCIRAFAWHQYGGGQVGMPNILAHFGYPQAQMLNVRAEDIARWAEFRVRLPIPKTGLRTNDYQRIGWIVGETKPARSVLAGIVVNSQSPTTVYVAGTTYTSMRVRLGLERVTAMRFLGVVCGGGYTHTVVHIRL